MGEQMNLTFKLFFLLLTKKKGGNEYILGESYDQKDGLKKTQLFHQT